MFAPVYRRIKIYPVVGNFIQFGERKNLKPAAVGENRSVPIHKFVQTARPLNKFVGGALVQMIGICKNNRTARLLQVFGINSFNRRLSADRHIYWRENIAVRGMEHARARTLYLSVCCSSKLKFLDIRQP